MKPLVAPVVAALVLAVATPGLADPAADTALIAAVYDGDLRQMQAALRAGASFNARDENGYTPLCVGRRSAISPPFARAS